MNWVYLIVNFLFELWIDVLSCEFILLNYEFIVLKCELTISRCNTVIFKTKFSFQISYLFITFHKNPVLLFKLQYMTILFIQLINQDPQNKRFLWCVQSSRCRPMILRKPETHNTNTVSTELSEFPKIPLY